MNVFAIIILSTLLISFILDLIADWLNLKALRSELPGEVAGIYDAQAYRRSQEYVRENTRFGLLTDVVNLAILLAFWFSGGFNFLDQVVRSWGWGDVVTGLTYFGMLILLQLILGLPFRLYDIFVIEERFGFNKTTPKTFVLDLGKGLALTVVLGGPLLAGILALFQWAGPWAWLYCWLATTAFSLFLQFIAPTWIMPLFNKFTPLEEGELKSAILMYARSVQFPIEGIFVIDGSRRSSKSNAFFTGFGQHKRIALFDTLIEKHSVAELVGIIAHEIGHDKKHHLLQRLVIGIVHNGLLFFLLSLFLSQPGLFAAFDMEKSSIYAGLLFFSLLYSPVELIISIFVQMFSRTHEYEADRFAAETTGNPQIFIDALKKLSLHNLSNLTPHPFYVFLHYSHPPLLERIGRIQN